MQNISDDYKKCNCCGRYYTNLTSNQVCINCIDTGNYDYTRVRDYLRNTSGKGTSLLKVSAELNIKTSRLLKFVEEGRFDVVEQNGRDSIITINKFKNIF